MGIYGEEEEEEMANSNDPVLKKIWAGKIELFDGPSYETVKPTYEGKEVMINWKSGIESVALVKFATPQGDPLVNIVYEPIFQANFNGWTFYKFNPWKATFNKFLRKTIESGLIYYYKDKTFTNQRKIYYESDEEKVKFSKKPLISALTIDDLQGLFYINFLMIACSFIAFFIERMMGRAEKIVTRTTSKRIDY